MEESPPQLSRRRMDTGIPGLNQLLLGGIPSGATVCVMGPPGVGKSILSKQFLYQGLIDGEPTLFLGTSESHSDVVERMHEFGWDAGLASRLVYGDCYSWKLQRKSAKYSASLENPTDVGIMVNQIVTGERVDSRRNPRMVIDSFSDFLLTSGEDRAISLLSHLKPRFREYRITTLVLLEEGLHAEKVQSTIEYLTDGTFLMRQGSDQRELMVSRMVSTPVERSWIPFTIRNGIQMRMASFFR